jgi:transcriptional regulator with XRE-family HTH domain
MDDINWSDWADARAQLDRRARTGIPWVPPGDMVAEIVRFHRAILGWKQDTLASFAGISLSSIERIERGDPVSATSLDRVAIALGAKPGTFTEPRLPFTSDQFQDIQQESLAPFSNTVPVTVRPLRTQPQVSALARAHLYLIDGSRLGEAYTADMAELSEVLDFVSFVLRTDDEDHTIFRDKPVKTPQIIHHGAQYRA